MLLQHSGKGLEGGTVPLLDAIPEKRGENGSSHHHMLSRFPGSHPSVEKLAYLCHIFCQFFHPWKVWTRKKVSLVSHSFHHSAILSRFPILIFPTSRPLSFKTGAISSLGTGKKARKIRIFALPKRNKTSSVVENLIYLILLYFQKCCQCNNVNVTIITVIQISVSF